MPAIDNVPFPRRRTGQQYLLDLIRETGGGASAATGLISPPALFPRLPGGPAPLGQPGASNPAPNVRNSPPVVAPSSVPFTRFYRPRDGDGGVYASLPDAANGQQPAPSSWTNGPSPLPPTNGADTNTGDNSADTDTAGLLAQLGIGPDGGLALPKRAYTFPAAPRPRALPVAPVYNPNEGDPLKGAGIAALLGLIAGGGRRSAAQAAGTGYLQGHRQGVDKRYSAQTQEYGQAVDQARYGNQMDRQQYADQVGAVENQIGVDNAADNLAIKNYTTQANQRLATQKQGLAETKARTDAEHARITAGGAFYKELETLDPPSQQRRLAAAESDGTLGALGITIKKNDKGVYDIGTLSRAAPPKAEDSPAVLRGKRLERELFEQYALLKNDRLPRSGAAQIVARISKLQSALGYGPGAPQVGAILDTYTPAQRQNIAARQRQQAETERAHRASEAARQKGLNIQQQNAEARRSGGAISPEAKAAQRALMKIQAAESSDATRDTTVGLPEKPLPSLPGVNLPAAHPAAVRGVQRVTNNAFIRNRFPNLRLAGASGQTAYFTLGGGGKQLTTRGVYHSLAGTIAKEIGGNAVAVFEMPGSRGENGEIVTQPRVKVTFGAEPKRGGGSGAGVKPARPFAANGAVPRLTGAPPPRFQQPTAPREVKVGGRSFTVKTIKGGAR